METRTYDAFISYSHARDRELAKSLQGTIERWGSAIPGRRSLRVCRDEASLSAHPDLWEAIKEKLSQSGYFILMASPESARSSWVTREVMHFVGKSEEALQRIGVVLTAGTLPWMKDEEPLPKESAIAPEVLALFKQEPLVVDLRSFRDAKSRAEYYGRVATIVAAILGKEKDEVFSDHLKAQRRFIASLVAGIVVLGVAIVLALVQFVRANEQAAEARRQRDRADHEAALAREEARRADDNAEKEKQERERADKEAAAAKREARRADEQAARAVQEAQRADMRAREATSRRLAEEADRFAEARIDTALLLMAQAYRMADNTAVRSSWWKLLRRPVMPSAFLPVEARSLRFKPDGSLAVSLGKRSVTFRESEGVWRSTGRPGEVVSTETGHFETWQWSGSCEDESHICSCSDSESRIIGPYGDQDTFCIGSELKVPGWCSEQPFQVPGVQVEIRREGPSVQIKTDLGDGEFACLAPRSAGEPGGRRPTLVAGTLSFFAGRPLVDRIASLGPAAQSLAQSHDGKWLAVLRADGGIEMWMGEGAPATSGRWGSTRLNLPAAAVAVAASPSAGSFAVATASENEGEQGGLVLWQGSMDSRIPLPAGKSIRPGESLALSEDGALVAWDVYVNLLVWSTSDRSRPPQELYLGRNRATSADFSRDRKLLAVTLQPLDGALPRLALFSIERGEPIREPSGSSIIGVRDALFHPTDSDAIVIAGDKGVHVWSLRQAKVVHPPLLQEAAVALAADRSRGRLAVSLADGSIAVWDPEHGRSPVRSGKRLGKGAVTAFLPGADAVLRVSDSGLDAWYWLEDTWLQIDDTAYRDATALRDGSVLGLTPQGQAVEYELDPARWLDQTCKLVGRNLTCREWNVYIGQAFPYRCTCPGHGPGAGCPQATCPSD